MVVYRLNPKSTVLRIEFSPFVMDAVWQVKAFLYGGNRSKVL